MRDTWGYNAVERGRTYSSWELQYHIRKNCASMRSRAAHSLSLFIQTTYLQIYPPLHYLRTTLVELLSASLPSPSTSTPEVHNECLTHSKKHSVQALSQKLSRRFSFTTFRGNVYSRGQNKVYVPFLYYGHSTVRTVFKKWCEIFTTEA